MIGEKMDVEIWKIAEIKWFQLRKEGVKYPSLPAIIFSKFERKQFSIILRLKEEGLTSGDIIDEWNDEN